MSLQRRVKINAFRRETAINKIRYDELYTNPYDHIDQKANKNAIGRRVHLNCIGMKQFLDYYNCVTLFLNSI